MNNEKLVASFTAFATSKNIDRPTVIRMLDDVLRALIEKKFGTAENFHIVINPEKGDLQIWRSKTIVPDDDPRADDDAYITLSKAQKLEPDFEVGEEASEEVDITIFGRRAITQGLQILTQRIQEIERDGLYDRYKTYEGELVYAQVYHMTPKFAILHDADKNELFLPKENQIPNEKYKKGGYIHAVIQEVTVQHNRLRIIVSRTSPRFLEKTLENQIDEIAEGIVKVKKVVRRSGQRAKVIVTTEDDRVDAVGACVGNGGQRIKNISRRELWNEQVDIIGDTDNETLFVKRALSPAQVHNVQKVGDRLAVYLKPEQVPLAIGAQGQNIDLASQLLGTPIDIYRELTPGQAVPLQDLSDEVDPTILEQLTNQGFHTIDHVIQTPKETLQEKSGLDPETLDNLYNLVTQKYSVNPHPSTPKEPQ